VEIAFDLFIVGVTVGVTVSLVQRNIATRFLSAGVMHNTLIGIVLAKLSKLHLDEGCELSPFRLELFELFQDVQGKLLRLLFVVRKTKDESPIVLEKLPPG
jgi:hypothetical protein